MFVQMALRYFLSLDEQTLVQKCDLLKFSESHAKMLLAVSPQAAFWLGWSESHQLWIRVTY
jgi:hypothetical protein